MTWNYRIVSYPDGEGDRFYEVHRAYYDDYGKLISIAEEPASVCGESLTEVRKSLNMIADAVRDGKGVITIEEIEEMEKGA